ncbi:DUF2247 family protein [Nocardia sp. FBN12]|uniref:DUF2247 family protein n=1 Tax=Nocardia sp. FBN12 TaxID=3419766 RepID=UPI003D013C19
MFVLMRETLDPQQWFRSRAAVRSLHVEAIELLYSDFEHPTEMEPFIPFMPAPAGATPGMTGLEERVCKYLTQRWQYFWVDRDPERPRGNE